MTTDITELAHRLATCAKEDTYPVLSPAECGALVEALETKDADAAEKRIAELEIESAVNDASNLELKQQYQRLLESRTVTVKPDDADEVREEGNQFLVVRHPGKVPVIKHPVGQLEDYLLQILKADPLATIDIVTHRYYGAGGQFVEDADEYLHEMGIKWGAE